MIARPEHVALSVSNLDRSIAFYCDLLGMKVCRILEPGLGGDKLGVVVDLPNCTARIAHLGMKGFMLELFEYQNPTGHPVCNAPNQAGLGFTHLGFTSTDTRQDYARLKEQGVEFISEPVQFRPEVWIVYFYGPDGEVCELRQT